MSNQDRLNSLYVHVPFCVSKCIYCDFNSITVKSKMVDEYLTALESELLSINGKYIFETIYIGGGTPTVLNEAQLSRLLNIMSGYIDKPLLKEFTIEINPGTLTNEKIQILRDNNINRASIGVQSFNGKQLKLLGRIHSSNEAKEAFYRLRENGFDNVNIDLIYGCPGQTLNEWKEDLLETSRLGPEHISAYCLSYEQETPLTGMIDSGALTKPGEDDELKMFECVQDVLRENGFVHYEISNFAKQGKECLHNIVYWKNEEYIGVGAGAFSFVNGLRYSNIKNVKEYILSVMSKKSLIEFSEKLPERKRASEVIIMALRMTSGISKNDFYNKSGFDLMGLFGNQVNNLAKAGLINYDNENLNLTKKGLNVADSVMMEFL